MSQIDRAGLRRASVDPLKGDQSPLRERNVQARTAEVLSRPRGDDCSQEVFEVLDGIARSFFAYHLRARKAPK